MIRYSYVLLSAMLLALPMQAKVVIFWQPGFPTVASQPIDRPTLEKALSGLDPLFADQAAIERSETFSGADVLVLPYGSSVPADCWKAMEHFLDGGGSLLILGGQPLRVPVRLVSGKYVAGDPQDTYSRAIGFRHTYKVPVAEDATFHWRSGYTWMPALNLHAQEFFTVEGRLNGLAYMTGADGTRLAAPVIVADRIGHGNDQHMAGSRIVALDFDPDTGYWESGDGIALIRQSAIYACQGAVTFKTEALYSVIRPGEPPVLTIHVGFPRQERLGTRVHGTVELKLASETGEAVKLAVPLNGNPSEDLDAPFHEALTPGFYTLTATLNLGGQPREFYENGFLVADRSAITTGAALGVDGDFLTLDGRPFFPVGTNYFSTEEDGWDFSGPRNAAVWDRDFGEMEAHGVSLVRTGVWMQNSKFIDPATGGVDQRFLRNLGAFLDCAHRHKIAVNFTFFAFSPHSGATPRSTDPAVTPPNPYLDPAELKAQQDYVQSVVEQFKDVPWLSWDLINEPSFSNPRQIFHGNLPNGDPAETSAWHKWLADRYQNLAALGEAWRVTPESLGSFDSIPLPGAADLRYERYGNPNQVRALDYNLFAQAMFSGWVKSMTGLIRSTGSKQLINVGQDEGGVTDRVLNQFYGGSGVSFTTDHTYWQDDALLWDSVAAKWTGIPNITGETGYQPAWAPDGTWRYDEFTGLGLTERKWVLGFAAGSTGAMQWDWDREVDFGMLRSDGSSKVWENQMRDLGRFARDAAPYGGTLIQPEVAIVLPESYQLSVANGSALDAQQTAVRALYNYARSQAYAVGEYQPELLGSPKLILLPSPFGLTGAAWSAIEQRVRDGATLLVTGPFLEDAHLHPTGRQAALGIAYTVAPLTLRENLFHFPGGDEQLTFSGLKTTTLSRAELPDGKDWMEVPLGKGKILFAALPLELNSNLRAVGDVYGYALKSAGIKPVYSTLTADPGILICPTQFAAATLYAITSESNQTAVSFTDVRSGRQLTATLTPGQGALLLVATDGKLLASYNWPGN